MKRLIITLFVGSAGGLLGYKLGIPVGALLGSMLAVGIYNCLGFESFMPVRVRVGAQIIVGCLLGLNLNPGTFMELKTIIVPALIIVTMLLAWGLITGFIVYKFFKVDLYTAFLSSSPGGMTELSLIASSMGGDGPKVVLLHTVRLLSIVSILPLLLLVVEKIL
jgi:membrane AbrB-like protein